MKKFNLSNKQELKLAKNDLLETLQEESELMPTQLVNFTKNGVTLNGGIFPAMYSHTCKTLTVWGRASRNSGGEMTVDDLSHTEQVIEKWFDEKVEL